MRLIVPLRDDKRGGRLYPFGCSLIYLVRCRESRLTTSAAPALRLAASSSASFDTIETTGDSRGRKRVRKCALARSHSDIAFVTPADRHAGRDTAIRCGVDRFTIALDGGPLSAGPARREPEKPRSSCG